MMQNQDWMMRRNQKIDALIEKCEALGLPSDDILELYHMATPKCTKCKYWADNHVGHYDSGNMATCMHPKIYGDYHHPSSGVGVAEVTLVYSNSSTKIQDIQTRWNFGCILWEKK